ncbi:helix-turn-helix domain-containing protein [Alicyclobacillus sp. SP_1]|uniref:helix-turn-helix domain-containing protein n=1 Tax=Alicyclobacillus sp. SP_1 TaxID=2942475 RepID=UPI0021589625|nr:helix-turn-helix transcriptional regulator [Alicyclobacillus sp. SP_1]
MQIGGNLRKIRLSKGLTQSEVAAALNVSVRQLQRWEQDENAPPLSRLVVICDFYDVDIYDILCRNPTTNTATGKEEQAAASQ